MSILKDVFWLIYRSTLTISLTCAILKNKKYGHGEILMRKLFMKNKLLLWLAVILLLSGCNAGRETTSGNESMPVEPVYIHTVRWPNETMAKIALWYTGKTDNWIEISRLNRNYDPSRLRKQCKIRIPKNLMVQFKPMPQHFAANCLDKKKKQCQANEVMAKQHTPGKEVTAGDIPLFGPK